MISESMTIDFDVRDMARVRQLLSHKEALMDCIPGLFRISDEEFRVVRKIAFFAFTLNGRITRFKFEGDQVVNDVEVWGHGIDLKIHSGFKFPRDGNKVTFFLEYTLDTSNPIVRAIASRESKVITADIFACISRKLLS